MEDGDLLLTIAEVAVAFAGFASLVSILGQRSSRDHPLVEAGRIRGMIMSALLVIFFAFLPFIPHRLGISEAAVWRSCSALLAVVGFAITFATIRTVREVRAAGAVPGSGFVRRGVILWTTIAVAEAALLANSFGIAIGEPSALYVTALLLFLFLSGFFFANVLLSFLAGRER